MTYKVKFFSSSPTNENPSRSVRKRPTSKKSFRPLLRERPLFLLTKGKKNTVVKTNTDSYDSPV